MKKLLSILLALVAPLALHADEFKSRPVTFLSGSSLIINPGAPLDGTWVFAAGSTVDLSAATCIGCGTGGTFTGSWADITDTPTTIAGYGITDAQAKDADLTSLSAASATGVMYYRSAAGTWSPVTLDGTMSLSGGVLGATGLGDTSTNTSSSVDGEAVVFSGTGGKTLKRAIGSGIATLTSGVLGVTTDNHSNWDTAYADRNKWDGGATGLTAATGRASLALDNVTNDVQTKASIVPNAAPSAGQVLVGSGTAYAKQTISGSGATISLASTGVVTIGSIANASLTNSSISIAGNSTALGASVTQDQITGLGTTGIVKRTAANTLAITADNSANWDTAFSDRNKWDGGSTGLTAATGRTSLGGTTVGQSVFTLANPSAITFLRMNADNSVTAQTANAHLRSIGIPLNKQIWVDSVNGSDGTAAVGDLSKPYQTIAAALAAATSGSVVYVASGTYAQSTTPLVIPANVTVACAGEDNTIITTAVDSSTGRAGVEGGTDASLSGVTISTTNGATIPFGNGTSSTAFASFDFEDSKIIGVDHGISIGKTGTQGLYAKNVTVTSGAAAFETPVTSLGDFTFVDCDFGADATLSAGGTSAQGIVSSGGITLFKGGSIAASNGTDTNIGVSITAATGEVNLQNTSIQMSSDGGTTNLDLNNDGGVMKTSNLIRADGGALLVSGSVIELSRYAQIDRNLEDLTDKELARYHLGLEIGVNVQAWNARLQSLGLLSYTGNALKIIRVNAAATGFELAASEADHNPTGTGFYHVTAGAMDPASVGDTGTGNVVREAAPTMSGVTHLQTSNSSGESVIFGKRFTNSSPVGHLILLQNSTGGVNLWDVDINGSLVSGTIPEARISWTDPNANTIRMWDDTDNAMTNAVIGANLSYDHATHTLSAAGGGSGGAPTTAKYITQTADATLSAEQALSSLATGLMKNTTSTGVISIATAGIDYSIVPTGTGFYHATGGAMDSASIGETGTGNVVLATNPSITDGVYLQASNTSNKAVLYGRRFTNTSPVGSMIVMDNADDSASMFSVDVLGQTRIFLDANNTTGLTIKRKTNTSPTGNFLDFQNASGSTIFGVTIAGQLSSGTVPEARITWTDPNINAIRMWDDTDNAYTTAVIGTGLSYDHATHTLSSTGGAGGGAPTTATYITQTADGGLSAEQALASLATGLLKNTTTTGVLSIAAAGTDYLDTSAISDTAFAASWDAVTTAAPTKNALYDYLHIADTDDDGKINVLDMGAGIVKTDAGGVVSAATAGTDYSTVPTGTGFYRTTAGVMDSASIGETGTDNVVRSTSPSITGVNLLQLSNLSNKAVVYGRRFTDTSPVGNFLIFDNSTDSAAIWWTDVQGQMFDMLDANGLTGLTIKRKTNTAPTGSFLDFQNASGSTVFGVTIAGQLSAGTVPEARITYTDPNINAIRMWDDTDNAYTAAVIGTNLSYDHATHTLSATGGGGAPTTATYITQTSDGTLSAEQALASLATGLLKNTTTTGVLSIAADGTDYLSPSAISDTAYDATSWDGATTTAPSKNAVRDKFQSLSVVRTVRGKWQDLSGNALVAGTTTSDVVTVPYSGTITGYSISADVGTCTVKVNKVADGTDIPTTVSNNISTSGVSLSSGTHVRSSTVSDFGANTTVTAGDMFNFNLFAVAGGATWVRFELEITTTP